MWQPIINIDYSKYYNKKVKIYYIDGYDEEKKYVEGILCLTSKNKNGDTTVSIRNNSIHPYEQYEYEYRTSIANNLIKKIYLIEPEITKTIYDLTYQKLIPEIGNEIIQYVEPYVEI
jgi:hypothetical protein